MKRIYNSMSKQLEVNHVYEVVYSGWGMIKGGSVRILGIDSNSVSYVYTDKSSISKCHGTRSRAIGAVNLSLGIEEIEKGEYNVC